LGEAGKGVREETGCTFTKSLTRGAGELQGGKTGEAIGEKAIGRHSCSTRGRREKMWTASLKREKHWNARKKERDKTHHSLSEIGNIERASAGEIKREENSLGQKVQE